MYLNVYAAIASAEKNSFIPSFSVGLQAASVLPLEVKFAEE